MLHYQINGWLSSARARLLLCRQPEVHVTVTVQSECESSIDGINRRLSRRALQSDEVQGVSRKPVSLCHANVVLTFQRDEINCLFVSLR